MFYLFYTQRASPAWIVCRDNSRFNYTLLRAYQIIPTLLALHNIFINLQVYFYSWYILAVCLRSLSVLLLRIPFFMPAVPSEDGTALDVQEFLNPFLSRLRLSFVGGDAGHCWAHQRRSMDTTEKYVLSGQRSISMADRRNPS